MSFDFDNPPPMIGTNSAKHDMAAAATGARGDDVIPMWVADMDFPACPAVQEALMAEAKRGVIGYYGDHAEIKDAIIGWMHSRYGWTIERDWIFFSHGVIHGLAITLEAYTEPGDGVILFTPVYHAFAKKIEAKDRRVVECELPIRDGVYHMDLEALAAQLDGSERMLIFCSPHNPGGRLWSAAEINALVDFCRARDILLVSDEIHMDLTFPGQTHLNTAVTAPQSTPGLVTLTAASKAFNIAGGETGFAIVGDATLRAKFTKAHTSHGGSPNRFGMIMTTAALTQGADWLTAATAYIAENARIFEEGVNAIPGLKVMPMQSTYLSWVDFSGTGMERAEFSRRVLEDASIAANHGPTFGTGGEQFMRFNVATSKARVEEAVARLAAAFGDLQ